MTKKLSRDQLLAAEMYGYSLANYYDHLGVNIRFDNYMPKMVSILEQAEREKWPPKKIAAKAEVDVEDVDDWMDALRRAKQVIDADNPAESFRNGIRQDIETAVKNGLQDSEDIEKLVIQICYRASDMSYLLWNEGQPLSRYSRHLRVEPNVGYYDGYFDEGDFEDSEES